MKSAFDPPLIAYGLLGIGVIAISTAAIFIKMTTAPPAITAFNRMWMTAVLLLPFAIRGLWSTVRSLSLRDRALLILSGAFLAVHFIFWIGSLFYTSVASSTLVLALQPIFAMIGAYALFGERTRGVAWIGAAVAVLGTLLIGWRDLTASDRAALGDLLSALGTLSVTGYMLAGQSLRKRVSALHYSFLVYIVAAGILALYSLWQGYSFTAYPVSEWRIFVCLAIVPTVFGHTLFNALLKYLPASTVSMSIVGEPIGATVLAYFVFGQTVPIAWYVGAALVLGGIALFLRVSHRQLVELPGK